MSSPMTSTPYHRLPTLRPEWSRRWRPLTTMFAMAMAHLVLASLLMVVSVVMLSVAGADRSIGQRLGDPTSPLDVFLQSALGAALVPAALLGVRVGGWRPPTLLWSVAGRFRGEMARLALPVVLPLCAVAAFGPLLVTGTRTEGLTAGRVAGVLIALVLFAPLQAAGEELAARGVGAQAIGTWLRQPLWAIVLPVPFTLPGFLLGGRGYDTSALVTAVVLGLACGALAWRSGGLEIPIVLHLGVSSMTALAALLGGPASPSGIAMPVVIVLVAAVLWVLVGSRERLGTTAAVERPADAPVPPLVRV